METKQKRGYRQLRRGRWSLESQIYHVTFVTYQRQHYLRDFQCARSVAKALRAAREHADTLAFVVMPDHVHWLLQLGAGRNLARVVGMVKADVSRHARPVDGGRLWQKGFYDHALRREEDVREVARYIIANPLRAGLVRSVRDYPHWDAVWL
ncbi:transposase [Granulosicoccaceae sp. 1_MG-2023]|nr:transposase [Granulosicoccaceae sp. 1_MG-2023]